jgi:hypothetical protein
LRESIKGASQKYQGTGKYINNLDEFCAHVGAGNIQKRYIFCVHVDAGMYQDSSNVAYVLQIGPGKYQAS